MAMTVSVSSAAAASSSCSSLAPARLAGASLRYSPVLGGVWKPRSDVASAQLLRAGARWSRLAPEPQWARSRVRFSREFKVPAQAKETSEEGLEADEDICELVNGYQVTAGEEGVTCYYIQALKNNNGAGILLLSDVYGFENNSTRDFAYRLGCIGYNVLIPDLFREDPWDEDVPPTGEEFETWRKTHTPENMATDIDAAFRWLKAAVDEQEEGKTAPKYGVVGFCIGGGLTIETVARSDASTFAAAVSFYGTRVDPDSEKTKNIKVPLLMLTGDQDDLSPVPVCEKLHKTLDGSKLIVYPGRGHAFAHRPDSLDDDEAAEQAYNAMRTWLKEKLLHSSSSK